jgi:hypothetical protein
MDTTSGSPRTVALTNWKPTAVEVDVVFVLPPIRIEALVEIPLAVIKTNANERNSPVGSALKMIAGQNAESTRIDWHRFVQAELGGEVGDHARAQHAGVPAAPHVFFESRYSCIRR